MELAADWRAHRQSFSTSTRCGPVAAIRRNNSSSWRSGADTGFDRGMFAGALAALDQISDAALTAYGIDVKAHQGGADAIRRLARSA